jgi:hypothetical protein
VVRFRKCSPWQPRILAAATILAGIPKKKVAIMLVQQKIPLHIFSNKMFTSQGS